MDTLVEFCRSGRLGPLSIGATAIDVERGLGRADDVKWVHGEPNWQRHRYGSLSVMLRSRPAAEVDPGELRLMSITVRPGRPLTLPAPIARGLTHDWESVRLDALLGWLRHKGIDVVEDDGSTVDGHLYQTFRVRSDGNVTVDIESTDGAVTAIKAEA
jgi:hypothetical protein